MSGEVAVLLSAGRHPVSGRPCVARRDASALELVLRCTDLPLAVHAGLSNNPVLSDYLGMGLPRLTVLDSAQSEDDILLPLVDLLAVRRPQIIVCGMQSEMGESSGMLPYLLAKKLGLPIISDVAAFEFEDSELRISQALAGGRRRRLAADLPVILTIGTAGPKPRQWTFAKARRGIIETIAAEFAADAERLTWIEKEARQRPRKLRAGKQDEKRQSAALTGLTPRQAAERLHDFLTERGIIKA